MARGSSEAVKGIIFVFVTANVTRSGEFDLFQKGYGMKKEGCGFETGKQEGRKEHGAFELT